MNAKETLDKARRAGAFWHDLAVLRRRVPEINSRARRMGAKGQVTADDLGDKLADAHGCCSSCDKDFGPRFGEKWTICFRVPLSMGGICEPDNVMIVCRECEMSRAAKLGVRWDGSGRARAARSAPPAPQPPVPLESSGTLVRMFCDDD